MNTIVARALAGGLLSLGALLGGCEVRPVDRQEGNVPSGETGIEPAGGFTIENSEVLPVRSRRGIEYDLFVKLPPGYGRPDNAGRRYPVIYLTDGAYTFQVASGISRLPFSQGRFDEFIIVGLSAAKGEDVADARRRDMTPWKSRSVTGISGGGGDYLEFIKTVAIPLIETRYRVNPANRTLAGQSYGGLFGLWVAFTEPELFRNYILTSPSIWFADRELLRAEAEYAGRNNDLKARIYLATGSREHPGPEGCVCEHDMPADQARLVKALRNRGYAGLDLRAELVAGSYHETTFPIGLMQGMQWLYLK